VLNYTLLGKSSGTIIETPSLLMQRFLTTTIRVLLAVYLFVNCGQVYAVTCSTLLQQAVLSPIVNVNKSIATATSHLLESGQLDYDSYFEIVIREVTPETLPSMLRSLLGDYGRSSTNPKTQDLIALIENEIGSQYTSLLMDPGIAFRADQFVEFARTESPSNLDMDPSALRKKFIESFEKKYYYRATLPEYSGQMVARAFQGAMANPPDIIRKSDTQIQSHIKNGTGQEYLSHLPILQNFHSSVVDHVLVGRTASSGVISISEHPEIAWHAVADNGQQLWKKNRRQFREGIHVRRISLNSYYALPRTILLEAFREVEGEYNIGKGNSNFRLPINDPSAELLMPIAVPNHGELRIYTPQYSPMRLGRSTFEIPKPEDWD
jgi:hypothetical protein